MEDTAAAIKLLDGFCVEHAANFAIWEVLDHARQYLIKSLRVELKALRS
jgi:hypothetical protein